MARWIVFDQDTAKELRSRLPQEAVFEAPGRAALEYALATPRTVVTVLASPLESATTIAVFRPGPRQTVAQPKPSAVRPAGFLGLNDQIVAEEEEVVPQKQWWLRLWRE